MSELTANDKRVLESIRLMPSDLDGWAPHGSADWTAIRRLAAMGLIESAGMGVCCDCDNASHSMDPTEVPMYRLPPHVPQPVPQVEQPPARADGQQHGDDGEGV